MEGLLRACDMRRCKGANFKPKIYILIVGFESAWSGVVFICGVVCGGIGSM